MTKYVKFHYLGKLYDDEAYAKAIDSYYNEAEKYPRQMMYEKPARGEYAKVSLLTIWINVNDIVAIQDFYQNTIVDDTKYSFVTVTLNRDIWLDTGQKSSYVQVLKDDLNFITESEKGNVS